MLLPVPVTHRVTDRGPDHLTHRLVSEYGGAGRLSASGHGVQVAAAHRGQSYSDEQLATTNCRKGHFDDVDPIAPPDGSTGQTSRERIQPDNLSMV